MTTLLEHFDFYVMPVINVDGYEYTWSHPSVRRAFLTLHRLCNVLLRYLWELSVCMLRVSFPSWKCTPQSLNLRLEFLHFCLIQTTTNTATNWHLAHSSFVSSKMLEMPLEMTESHSGIFIVPEVRERLCQPSAVRLQILAQFS